MLYKSEHCLAWKYSQIQELEANIGPKPPDKPVQLLPKKSCSFASHSVVVEPNRVPIVIHVDLSLLAQTPTQVSVSFQAE